MTVLDRVRKLQAAGKLGDEFSAAALAKVAGDMGDARRVGVLLNAAGFSMRRSNGVRRWSLVSDG